MNFHLKTWYKKQDRHGNSIACVKFTMETANIDFRNRVVGDIEKALPLPEPGNDQKPTAMGFQHFED